MNKSTTTVLVPVTLALMITGLVHLSAKGGPPRTGPNPATSTVFDTDSFGNPTLLQSDETMAGSAVYNGDLSPGVISQIDSTDSVDWNLDLRGSSRGFYLTLVTATGDPVSGLPGGPTFYTGRVVSRCYAPAGGTTGYNWFGIIDDPNCAMRVNFTWGTTGYTLVMSPLYSSTGRASVHCNALAGSSCVDWTVTPNPNAANAGVANLYLIGKNGSEKFVAACKLTFRMHVTYP